jgi:hypothetical protein
VIFDTGGLDWKLPDKYILASISPIPEDLAVDRRIILK